MADDITDVYIATEAGDAGWQSLSALAAAQVEVELPISDARDPVTVTLDSPSANTFAISTGGSERVIVTSDGRVGFGATPSSSVQFQNTAKNATGMRSDITHNSATRYNNSDGQLMVSTAAGTSNIAVMSGFRIVGRSNAGATVDQYYGIYVAAVPTDAGLAAGLRTVMNGDGDNEGQATASGLFNIYADGNAPNYFGGEVRITPTAQLNVNKIVGSQAPDSDAGFELGAELLTTNHTPTQQNSIATKKYTDDADVVLQNNINQKAEIWVGTTASYLALGVYNNQTLYCLTD